jgi:hypothetical protein
MLSKPALSAQQTGLAGHSLAVAHANRLLVSRSTMKQVVISMKLDSWVYIDWHQGVLAQTTEICVALLHAPLSWHMQMPLDSLTHN